MDNQKQTSPKVCILRRDYYPLIPHVRRDAETLISAGLSVDVVCMRKPGQAAREEIDGVQVYRLPISRRRGSRLHYLFEYMWFFALASFTLAYLAVKKRYDVIEVDTMPDFLVFAAAVPKLLGTKVVLYLFECMPELFEDTYELDTQHPMIRALRLIERRASRFADHVIYCGPGYRDIQEPRVGKPIQSTVVLNVPDESVFCTRTPAEAITKEANEPFRVITHGSLLKKYGVQALVRAVPIIRETLPNLEVCIAGDGEYRVALQELAAELDVDDIITFTGLLPARSVADIIAQSDVAVVAIEHPFMLPSKMFEYMAMRIPVVSSEIDFIKGYCRNDEVSFFGTGDASELAQRIIWLHDHPTERENQVQRADQLYQSARWSITREKYLDVYRSLTNFEETGEGEWSHDLRAVNQRAETAVTATGARDDRRN